MVITSMCIGISAALGAFDGSPRAVPAESSSHGLAQPAAGLASVPPAITEAFRAFRRPAIAADKTLVNNASALQGLYQPQQHFAINPSLARQVYAGPQGRVYLVPGQGDNVCLVVIEAHGGVTVSSGLLSADNLAVMSDDGTATTITGVLPDHAKALVVVGGTGASYDAVLSPDHGYWVSVPSRARSLSVTDASGVVHKRTLPR